MKKRIKLCCVHEPTLQEEDKQCVLQKCTNKNKNSKVIDMNLENIYSMFRLNDNEFQDTVSLLNHAHAQSHTH